MIMDKTIACYSGCLDDDTASTVLSVEEWRQAKRFTRPERRRQFIQIRSLVRQHLADYVGTQPQQLNILRTSAGKPYLADYPDVFFNLSHCQNNWVLVITTTGRIGVDIELIRPRNGMQALVKRCFSAAEQQSWNAMPEDEKQRRFYQYWTAKEAFVKAVGQGIALGLDKVQIAFTPQPQLLQIPVEYGEIRQWRLLMPANENEQVVMVCVESRL